MTPSNPETNAAPSATVKIDWPRALAQHQGWLRTVILARLGEAQAIEEVLQEVSLAAVRQSVPLRDPTKVAPWLYRLAVIQSLLYRRKRGRRRKLLDRFVEKFRPTEHDMHAVDPLGWLVADERRKLVRLALAKLPKRDAEILLLKYTQDWSYHQIAQHIGISHSAVETRLHRARAKLRSELVALEVVEA